MSLQSNKQTSLVLSGGGVRGMAHIGFIKALQEHHIKIDRIAGSSAGALVGALFANGNSTEDMLSFFKEAPLFKYNYFIVFIYTKFSCFLWCLIIYIRVF